MSMELTDAAEEARYQGVQGVDVTARGAADVLVRALYDRSWRVRKRAAERVAAIPDQEAVISRLVHVLSERDETGARNAAAEALVRVGAPALPALTKLLRHPDPDQRKFAADILGLIGHPDGEAALIAALGDVDANVRAAAAEALGSLRGPNAARALEGCLSTDDSLLRLSALEALMRLGVPPPLPVLAALQKEPLLRRAATRLMGFVRQPAALKEIARALGSEVPPVREAALGAIGLQLDGADPAWASEVDRELAAAVRRDGDIGEWLLEGLDSEDVMARRGSLECIGWMKDPAIAARVATAAEDDRLGDQVVRALVRMGAQAARDLATRLDTLSAPARMAAVEALVQLAEPALVPTLEELTESQEVEVRLLAVRALGRSQSSAALPRLAALISDPEVGAVAGRAIVEVGESLPGEARTALDVTLAKGLCAPAVRAWARLVGADGLPLLRRAAREPDPAIRAAAAEGAGEVGAAAAELLQTLLADEALAVRSCAAHALARLPADRAEPLLKFALADREVQIRLAAMDAVAECGLVDLSDVIRSQLSAQDAQIATRAIAALARLGRFDAQALSQARAHQEPEVLREALDAGAALPEAVDWARSLLSHPRWDVRIAAARVLSASGGHDAEAEIDRALQAEADPLVREALEKAKALLSRR